MGVNFIDGFLPSFQVFLTAKKMALGSLLVLFFLWNGVRLVWKAVTPAICQPSVNYTLRVRGWRSCRFRCPDSGAVFYPAGLAQRGGTVMRHGLTLFRAANGYNVGSKR